MIEAQLIELSGICCLAVICQWIAWRLKLPAILFLLLIGILCGPTLGWIQPDRLFGDLLFPLISLSVAIILFEGGLTLKLSEIKGLETVVQRLVSIGLLTTWIIIAISTHWLLAFSWELSFLFGALVVVTGPTVITPMLRTVRPNNTISNILRWEGIVIDPIGALLAVLVFEFIISSSSGTALEHVLLSFGSILLTGIVIGSVAGYALGLILRYFLLPEFLHNLASLSFVFAAFTSANLIMEESGLLAVTLMGMWLANMKNIHIDEIIHFKEHLSVLLISGLFIILAARIEFEQITYLGLPSLGVLAAIQLVGRPVKVLLATFNSSLKWQEKVMLAWIAPRGIVAAAVSALFALRLEEMGFHQAQLIVPLTFIIIIGTVILQSTTARWLALKLDVAEPNNNGLLIIGANSFAIELATTLNKLGFKSVLTDSYWNNIKTARMKGLKTYFGNPISEHADQNLDLLGLGKMLALSPQDEHNALACIRFRNEFGRSSVYSLPSSNLKSDKTTIALQHRGLTLFKPELSYSEINNLLHQGAEIKVTSLSKDFSYADFIERYQQAAVPLLAITNEKKLTVVTVEESFQPKSDSQIISLILPNEEKKIKQESEALALS